MNTEIGRSIKAHRKRMNMTQSELAKKLNKSLRTIQKYESGEIKPPLEVLDELSAILEVSLYELIGSIDLPFWEIPELSKITNKYAWEVIGIDKESFLERCGISLIKAIYDERLGEDYVNDSIEIAKQDGQSNTYNSKLKLDKNQLDINNNETNDGSVEIVDPMEIFIESDYINQILSEVYKLNIEGKKRAIDSIKLLTKIPEYQNIKEEGD